MINVNKRFVVITLVLIFMSTFAFTQATVGSTNDPLITLSYLEKRLAESGSSTTGEVSLFEVLELGEGDILMLGKSTEVILRAGIAKAFVSDLGGLADVTEGYDLYMDQSIPKNHLIICPLDDGRGFIFESTAWIMIKGDYKIYSTN